MKNRNQVSIFSGRAKEVPIYWDCGFLEVMINFPKTLRSFKFAIHGIFYFLKNENNARVHMLATTIVIGAGFYFHISVSEWQWLVFAITLVWVSEIFNTALEKLVDLVSPSFDLRAGIIKDLAAGAVLIAAIAAFIIGCFVFKSHLFL